MSSSARLSAEKSRLRMDSYSTGRSWGRPRGSPPRRRELDNVMKKARKEGPDKSSYWNKKLLEVEERDPNRWRHSGFKELYGGGSERKNSNSRSRSRSRSRTRSRSRSRSRGRSRSFRPRSPRSPRSPPPRPKSPPPRPPSPRKNRSRPRSPKSPRTRPKSPPPKSKSYKPRRPPSPVKARSESLTSGSVSSCSDESCSVCSPKSKRRPPPIPKEKERERPKAVKSPRPPPRSRSRSFSVPRSKPAPVEKPRRKTKRKRDKEKSKTSRRRRPVIKVESESERSSTPASPGPRLTLSERFGKMAQWSVDRDLERHRNLRITAGDQYTVEMDSPPSPPYAGSLPSLPDGTWDDVRVRYTYYKERGYLRDLTLQDYVKWEEWWYKYQDWLENERYYDRLPYRRRL